MKKIRIISAVLAILLAFSAVCLPVFAADPVTIDVYPTTEYESMRDRLTTMEEMFESKEYGYKMYFDLQSGEFALENTKTGELTFSNPYDVATDTQSSASQDDNDPILHALLSQVILRYTDTLYGTPGTMLSYTHAALPGGQIQFKNIDNGVRVEYAMGTVETKRLLPRWIEKSRFQTQILDVLATRTSEFTSSELNTYNGLTKSEQFYKLLGPVAEGVEYDPTVSPDPAKSESFRFLCENADSQMYYLLQLGERAMKNIESLIRKYVPEYTFDKLEEDHEITGYEGEDREPALFRLAVEYVIDEDGLTVSVPAKSIRYNETNYSLESITILPYFGCTTLKPAGAVSVEGGKITKNGGYIFIPDGSGALLSYYEPDGSIKSGVQGGSLYGLDYAIESIEPSTPNAEIFRLPVFGLTETSVVEKNESRPSGPLALGTKTVSSEYARGFFAIIEEGDSFASISADLRTMTFGDGDGGTTEYSTVYATFAVKQSDSVSIGSALGGSNTEMSTTNTTKYTGNYSVRYILLSDPATAEAKGIDYYEPSYIGMANAYRDQLLKDGAIEKMTSGEVESSIPLYIHSFGALDTEDTFLSFPVTVEKPLTTFEDVITMADTLKNDKITNVNFILEGFANGNMTSPYYPSYLKWNKTVGGKSGLGDLLEYAQVNGIGIFPEFDFATVSWTKTFSGFSYRKHAAQTMSGRYTTRREYDPVYQQLAKFGMGNIVSSGAYMTLFEKFAEDYEEYEIGALSALSLGTDLSSDFNEDYPLTREESKINTQDLLAAMKESQKNVLVEGGNAYTLPYVSDIVNLPLDNSNYEISSNSVPFIGLVLHGYMNYAGGIINTEGDIQYEVLKSLENGAALYFLLSYQNTSEIKSAYMMGLNENYSVAFTTWYDEVVKNYNTLNGAIGALQTAQITNHEFLTAFRLEGTAASFMFAQSNVTRERLAQATEVYYRTMDEVDELNRNNMETAARAKQQEEVVYRGEYLTASARQNLEAAFTAKYATAGVVAVTYTDDKGNDTMFFINYNSYDVAVQYGDGIFMLGAEAFVKASDVKTATIGDVTYEVITAKQPTKGQLDVYETAKANYDEAVASGNQTKITRTLAALNKALTNIVTSTSDVIKLTDAAGNVAYFNYTDSMALVPLSETEYFVIPAQSYVLN